MRKKRTDKIESVAVNYDDLVMRTPQKKVVVNVFFNESDLADFIRNHPDYVIIQVFANEGHSTGIFMFYE
mgnify:CR=1 FL=1